MAAKPGTSGSYPDNKYPGLHTGTVELHSDVNMKAIPPNGKRPVEVTATKHLFSNFSD